MRPRTVNAAGRPYPTRSVPALALGACVPRAASGGLFTPGFITCGPGWCSAGASEAVKEPLFSAPLRFGEGEKDRDCSPSPRLGEGFLHTRSVLPARPRSPPTILAREHLRSFSWHRIDGRP